MKIAALTTSVLLLALTACSTTSSAGSEDTTYGKSNSIVTSEIEGRVAEIPYQHRDELLENLLWLAQTGEPAIPTLLNGMTNPEPKVRSSCAWVLGRIGDRRVIESLRNHTNDSTEAVRLEVCRTLVLLGDLQQAPTLIEGLDSDRREVRYMCHEALKTSTGRDFGYDHLTQDVNSRRSAALSWRKWWSDYSGDTFFASSYASRHQIQENAVPASPLGETSTGSNTSNGSNGNSTSTWTSHDETMEEGSGNRSNDPNGGNGNKSNGSGNATSTTGTNGSTATQGGQSPASSGSTTSSSASTTGSTSPSNGSTTTNPTSASTTTNSTTNSTRNSTTTTNSTNGTGTSTNATTNPGTGTSTSTNTGTNTSTNTGTNSNNPSTGSGNGSSTTTGSSTGQTTRQG